MAVKKAESVLEAERARVSGAGMPASAAAREAALVLEAARNSVSPEVAREAEKALHSGK